MAKFSGFKTLKNATRVDQVIQYLTVGLSLSLKELQAGLTRLSFEDNFDTQVIDVIVPLNSTVAYPHNLGVIPSKRLIVKQSGSTIDDSVTPWTETVVYFRNTSTVSADGVDPLIARIVLMR